MPGYFLVRIDKQKQKDFKEKISNSSLFFMPIGSIHNSRNVEHGEVMMIGDSVKNIYGWDIHLGDTLIFHHTIESKDGKLLYDDEKFNYYAVNEINARGYANASGKVIPHPGFIFLKNIPAFENSDAIDESTGNRVKKTEGGIFVLSNWKDSPQDLMFRSTKIKDRIESLTKMKRTAVIQAELEKLEEERHQLNRESQKPKYIPYKVAYSNRKLDRDFGFNILEDRILWCLNKECLYITNYQPKEYTYIIARVEGIGWAGHY